MLNPSTQIAEGAQAWEQDHFGEESSKCIKCQPVSALVVWSSGVGQKRVQILAPTLAGSAAFLCDSALRVSLSMSMKRGCSCLSPSPPCTDLLARQVSIETHPSRRALSPAPYWTFCLLLHTCSLPTLLCRAWEPGLQALPPPSSLPLAPGGYAVGGIHGRSEGSVRKVSRLHVFGCASAWAGLSMCAPVVHLLPQA